MKAIEYMQENIKEAINARISAPYFGYIFLAFISINWKSIIYMFFANTDILDRIQFVESHITYLEGLVYPIVIGAALTLSAPWLKLWVTGFVAKPSTDCKALDVKSEYELVKLKKALHDAKEQQVTAAMLEEALKEVEQRNQELAHSQKKFESVKEAERELANQRFEDKKKLESLTLEVQDLSNKNNDLTRDFVTMKKNLTEKDNELEELKQQNKVLYEKTRFHKNPAENGLKPLPDNPKMIRR